jgi:isocitrate dehydrogenase kinase/phosphatase
VQRIRRCHDRQYVNTAIPSAAMNDYELAEISAQRIYEGFLHYNEAFVRVTERACQRFAQRDWRGHQQDIVDRVDMYERAVGEIVDGLRELLGQQVIDRTLWKAIRGVFDERLENVPDVGFMKTFFNSITRRIFGTVGVNRDIEFLATPPEDEGIIRALSLCRFPYWGSLEQLFAGVLWQFEFDIVHYANMQADAQRIAHEVQAYAQREFNGAKDILRFEFINSIFYQSARAYLVGRIILRHGVSPIVIALENADNGIQVDAVLLSDEDVSIVFSYTRSYYFAEPNSVVAAVHFLHTVLPDKPIDELYTVLGRLRQGKTERHRIFTDHLEISHDEFVRAAGETGLVMIVFTLPSYDLVFKVIRDRFGPPKTVTRQDVLDKYKLVSKHDRAGRLIDTQEFRRLDLPLNRFSAEMLNELLQQAAETVHIKGGHLIFEHVYIERRVRPLNLYIREVPLCDAEVVVIDYGQAIKDLAYTNIFPGDLLLKNFGVTKQRRVVFYDYDEVALVTECNFRELPEADDDDEGLMRPNDWFYVDKDDIFPQEFLKFLAMDSSLRELFVEVHGDLLTAEFWRDMKLKHLAGDISLVVPYHRPPLPESRAIDRRRA